MNPCVCAEINGIIISLGWIYIACGNFTRERNSQTLRPIASPDGSKSNELLFFGSALGAVQNLGIYHLMSFVSSNEVCCKSRWYGKAWIEHRTPCRNSWLDLKNISSLLARIHKNISRSVYQVFDAV
jgi:hypothetical protein